MAHTKSVGSTKLGRDSAAKRLGVKANHGEAVRPGQIIIRQRGTHYIPAQNTKLGSDDTIYAAINGKVKFFRKSKTNFDGSKAKRVFVQVEPNS